jgi:hypothetical protein
MSLRSVEERRTDILEVLARNGDGFLATASRSGRPHLIAVSTWWDGTSIVMATRAGSRTARNLHATGQGRLALGSPEDVVLLDVAVADGVPVGAADARLRAGFAAAVGWDPAEEVGDWELFRLSPVRMQAYRGYRELSAREVMRDARWLT